MSALYNKHGNTIEKPNEGFAVPVVDNLTSDATNHALSAKQGKTLKGLIDDNTDDIEVLNSNLTQYAHATLESGETEVVINDNRIVSTSIIEPFFEVALGTEFEPLSYSTMKVEVGKVTFTFDSQDTDIEIYIRVL